MKHLIAMVFTLLAAAMVLAADDAKPLPPTYADLSYGPHVMNVLDFWKAEGDGPRPLLVYIHGGGWIGGDKKQPWDRIRPYLEKGIFFADNQLSSDG